jgi:predicted dehydrogenase
MTRRLRGTLIGCGFFAENHLNAWASLDGVELAGVCDLDAVKAEAAAHRFGAGRWYTDAARMLEAERPDFVDIATTVGSHRSLVELAAAHRVPAIVQKPFAPSLADAEAMVRACDEGGVPLMVHENFRWQSPMRRVKALLDEGAIGRPHWGRISFRTAHDVYAKQPYLATDVRFIIADLGIHLLDLARFFFGEVDTLACRTRRVNPAIRGEDQATILLTHDSGVVSVVDCCYATAIEPDPFPETLLEIDGDEGIMRLRQGYRLELTRKGEGTSVLDLDPPVLPWAEKPWHAIQESVLRIQEHWVQCLRAGREPETSGGDNLRTFALVERAYAAAEA